MINQAMAYETMDLIDMYKAIKERDIEDKIYFARKINKYYWKILTKWLVRTYPRRKKLLIMMSVKKNVWYYQDELFWLVHIVPPTIYEWETLPKPHKTKKNLFDNIQLISEETSIPIDEVDKRITYEQKVRRTDKITRDYLNSFDEWEKLNKQVYARINKDEYDRIAREIDEDFNS